MVIQKIKSKGCEWSMMNLNVTSVPAEYKRAVSKELRGSVNEVSYPVRNYINSSRQLVTNQKTSIEQTGRETVEGEAIVKTCNVYLPAGYEESDKNTKYDVLYMLHGVGGNRHEWLHSNGKADGNFIICNIFDNLIANSVIDPVIIVFPEGRSAHDWTDCSFNSEGTNLLGFYYFDYELRYDLIPFIESKYKTYANIQDTSLGGIAYNRLHRAIAGLSMGGMQCLNLIIGGYRCDSSTKTGTSPHWNNGLHPTVLAPGMVDLFSYIGAFSNAPTSSDGNTLAASIASSGYRLNLLYLTCGDADGIAIENGYAKSVEGLTDAAGEHVDQYYKTVIKGGLHDFNVWNNGAYNFLRLAFRNREERLKGNDIEIVLNTY